MPPPKYTRPENERRWLCRDAPRGPEHDDIEDRYIDGSRLRLRRISRENGERVFKLAKKWPSDDPLTRPIVNIYLDEREHALLDVLPGPTLRKRRHHIEHDGRTWSIDCFAHAPLILCEVECDTLPELAALQPPAFCAVEVTDDPFFSGGALCRASADEIVRRRDAKLAQSTTTMRT